MLGFQGTNQVRIGQGKERAALIIWQPSGRVLCSSVPINEHIASTIVVTALCLGLLGEVWGKIKPVNTIHWYINSTHSTRLVHDTTGATGTMALGLSPFAVAILLATLAAGGTKACSLRPCMQPNHLSIRLNWALYAS